MGKLFSATFRASWGTMDHNSHMANTAYLDLAADTRFLFFESNGMAPAELFKIGIGPVVRKDEVEYFHEFRLMEMVTVEFRLAGISEDGSRMILDNRFLKENGELAATVRSIGGWLDLKKRTLTCPTDLMLQSMLEMERTEDFQWLPSSLKAKAS